MNLYPIISSSYPASNYINFKSQAREVHDSSGKHFLYNTMSSFFRTDLDWDNFIDILDTKYAKTEKVNIINHACSCGEEAYSLATKLTETFGEDASKYLPIIAKDIDKQNIQNAIKGSFNVTGEEYTRIKTHTNHSSFKYFDSLVGTNPMANRVMSANHELKSKISFSEGNILKDAENIPSSNTVLMCRNFWSYLAEEDRENLAEKLGKKLDKSCLLVVGEFDYNDTNIYELLTKNGFKPHPKEINIFCKEW